MIANSTIPNSTSKPSIGIRDLDTIQDIEGVLRLEKEVWDFEDVDVTPLTLAVAMKAAGSILVGAFDGTELVGFAFAFPSLEHGRVGFHSHTLAVRPSYQSLGLGYRLKVAQRQPGGEHVLNYVGPGGYVGEIGLMSHIPEIQKMAPPGGGPEGPSDATPIKATREAASSSAPMSLTDPGRP